MTYVVISDTKGETQVDFYSSLYKAQAALMGMSGDVEGVPELRRIYYTEDGGVVALEERPAYWSPKLERDTMKAYDAREHGTATRRQINLLSDLGW